MDLRTADPPPSVALVGIHGHGRSHLRNVLRLQDERRLRLTALVDPRPLPTSGGSDTGAGTGGATDEPELAAAAAVPWHADLATLLAQREVPDVVVLCTPIHTHHALATLALRAGCDVLLEKPPTASLAEHRDLLAVQEQTGRLVQVGFQTFGSATLDVLDRMLAAREIGELTGIGAVGTWVRSTDYWTRSPWTGHRTLDGRAVMDGVVTNPLAHAVVTALRLAGARTADDVTTVRLDQYRANAIETDDTSALLVTTSTGVPVSLGLTLCAATHTTPRVTVQGSTGRAVLDYYADTVRITGPAGSRTVAATRTDLLTNLLEHRADRRVPLLCPLEDTGAFSRVLEAVRAAPAPTLIGPPHVELRDDGEAPDGGAHLVVPGVEQWCARVAAEHRTFAELGAPWALVKTPPWDPSPRREPHGVLLEPALGAMTVARYVDGAGSPPFDAPRPHLHPVRTLAGVVVTDAAPADHSWHVGLSIGVQDVAGANLWGGRTYRPGTGYTWRRDHGTISHRGWLGRTETTATQTLTWADATGTVLLDEVRELAWVAVDPGSWRLHLAFSLSLPPGRTEPVELGSPGSHGRHGGGYGGMFWRIAQCADVEVRTPLGRGEQEVHGSRPADGAHWLAWSANVEGRDVTLAVAPADAVTADDPWFVRVGGYPGIGSALSWSAPVQVIRGAPVRRSFTWLVADGRLTDEQVTARL